MSTDQEPVTYSPITRDHSYGKHIRARQLRRQMTSAERKLWWALQRQPLQDLHFRAQQTILGFIADFYCHKARLVVELDGPVHKQTCEYDLERDRVLRSHGYRVMRFANQAVYYDFERVLFEISQVAYKRASANISSID